MSLVETVQENHWLRYRERERANVGHKLSQQPREGPTAVTIVVEDSTGEGAVISVVGAMWKRMQKRRNESQDSQRRGELSQASDEIART